MLTAAFILIAPNGNKQKVHQVADAEQHVVYPCNGILFHMKKK
jgi:hypothetical protein